jgi:hypothetical protein
MASDLAIGSGCSLLRCPYCSCLFVSYSDFKRHLDVLGFGALHGINFHALNRCIDIEVVDVDDFSMRALWSFRRRRRRTVKVISIIGACGRYGL